jgi:hypothetical protein
MSSSHIVALLIEERSRLQAAIDALHGTPEPGLPEWVGTPAPAAKKKRRVSAAARKRISDATKARWAKVRAARAEAAAPVAEKKTKAAIIAEVIEPKEDAEFKSKMSIAMAKSWKKRKKAAKKRK